MPRTRIPSLILAAVLLAGTVPLVSPALSQEPQAEETETKKEKKKKEGRRKGAIGGAILGLGLGALTGDAELAAKGAAAGALVGGVSGDWYDYDQSRQDDRTRMLAEGLAGSKSADSGASAAPAGATVGDVGKSHMQEFLGEWTIDAWVLTTDGKRVPGRGTARGLAADENATRVLATDLTVAGSDDTVGGQLLLTYEPGQGFFAESSFDFTDETLRYVGEYLVDRNAYVFYLVNGGNAEMLQGGILRSSVRMEIRVSGAAMWVLDVFTHIDGEETLVQSYRFTRG